MSGHHWTTDDDKALTAAYDELKSIEVADWRRMKVGFWQAVAGRMAPAVLVSPNAC